MVLLLALYVAHDDRQIRRVDAGGKVGTLPFEEITRCDFMRSQMRRGDLNVPCQLSDSDCRGKAHNEMNVILRAIQRINATPQLLTLSLDMSVYASLCLRNEQWQPIPGSPYKMHVHLNL